jgi:hypothetical protein
MPRYGRDHCARTGDALLALAADVDVGLKLGLAVALTQQGIDRFWDIANGWSSPGNGGQGSGRLVAVVFAGLLLDDAFLDYQTWCRTASPLPEAFMRDHRFIFGENGQTLFRPGDGVAEWGHDAYSGQWSTEWFSNPYRLCCTANAWHAQALVMRAMGGTEAWAWPAFFAYQDRYVREMSTANVEAWTRSWHPAHWDEYVRLRKEDLPGCRTIGLPEVGKPRLTVTIPPHEGMSWTVHLHAGKPIDLSVLHNGTGIILRAAKTKLRPTRSFAGVPTDGLVFVDWSTTQAAVGVQFDTQGKCVVTIPPAGDVAGATYVLQAAVLLDGAVVPTQAVEVIILPPQ